MRYYHPFPEAIPHSEAGSSRVTHPSATKIFAEANASVRLACVKRAASVRPEPGSNSLKSCIFKELFFQALLISIQSITNFRSQLPFFFVRFLVFSDFSKSVWFQALSSSIKQFQGLHFFFAFSCSTLFNFQDTFYRFLLSFFMISYERQLIHYIISLNFCQVNKLWISLNSAELPFTYLRSSLFSFTPSRSLPTALLLYHNCPLLSTPFSSFYLFYSLFSAHLAFYVSFIHILSYFVLTTYYYLLCVTLRFYHIW